MKKNSIMKLAAGLTVMMIASVTGLQAQTNVLNLSTNGQTINFALILYEQGLTNTIGNVTKSTVTRVRVTSKDIIKSLGLATSNSFSADAKLLLFPGSNNTPVIEVVDLTNIVDVSSSFLFDTGQSNVVGALVLNNITGALSGVEYAIIRMDILNSDLTTNLDLSGFATIKLSTKKTKAGEFLMESFSAQIAGTGQGTNGAVAVVKGTVNSAQWCGCR